MNAHRIKEARVEGSDIFNLGDCTGDDSDETDAVIFLPDKARLVAESEKEEEWEESCCELNQHAESPPCSG